MNVPFLDLKAQYESIKDEINGAIQKVLKSTAFAGGLFVEKFEEEFAGFCGSNYAVGVGSGTEALWLTLLALGIQPGDEIITVPNSFIATAEAISFCGAVPVFVDVDEKTYTINISQLEQAITAKTKAIIPVHLFGQTADMEPLNEIAERHGVPVVEDACQAHGAEYRGKMAGSIGIGGCFSFYPGKNLGAYGEAGALVTNDALLYECVKKLRDHGQSRKYHHDVIGWNSRMDGIQGAILSVKLKHLENWNDLRRRNAANYTAILNEVNDLVTPYEAPERKHIYHVYAIRVRNRDFVINQLKGSEVSCGIHYPIPIHLQKAYEKVSQKKATYPVSEICASEFISLPMYPELTKEKIEYVTEKLVAILHD
jgi:dTDP-4-amino-4,6-dideoxygalactose transaminase